MVCSMKYGEWYVIFGINLHHILNHCVYDFIQRSVDSFIHHVVHTNPTHYQLSPYPISAYTCMCIYTSVGEGYAREVGKYVEGVYGKGRAGGRKDQKSLTGMCTGSYMARRCKYS
ncbi:hypothetical protein EON63_10195, partial [archaeon]